MVGFGLDYPDGTVVGAHAHDRAQVLCGLSGIVAVSTGTGAWMMTPEHGLWIPAEVVHAVRMIGAVRMRSLYLRPDALPGMPGDCTVLAMTPLVRSMIAEVTLLP
ncbi:AraC family ligand binding domain-containing protein, partial [Jatrophihabitans endophyticus]|uniref:AraC family ligand binding domain-containing protein n=1 Tax=Jatrophihabitans endophyticus TaxID=1206085 RepID=UPI0019F35147